MLTESPLVGRDGNDATLDVYDYVSIECYYEELLEKMTEGTPMEYHHGAHLPKEFLNEEVPEDILDSDVGRMLLEYIWKMRRDDNGL